MVVTSTGPRPEPAAVARVDAPARRIGPPDVRPPVRFPFSVLDVTVRTWTFVQAGFR
jgi:hypothetical protein